jgi:hypothetical protein
MFCHLPPDIVIECLDFYDSSRLPFSRSLRFGCFRQWDGCGIYCIFAHMKTFDARKLLDSPSSPRFVTIYYYDVGFSFRKEWNIKKLTMIVNHRNYKSYHCFIAN